MPNDRLFVSHTFPYRARFWAMPLPILDPLNSSFIIVALCRILMEMQEIHDNACFVVPYILQSTRDPKTGSRGPIGAQEQGLWGTIGQTNRRFFFRIFGLTIGLLWFIIGLRWPIKAWGLAPNIIFGIFETFHILTKCWTLDPSFIAEIL